MHTRNSDKRVISRIHNEQGFIDTNLERIDKINLLFNNVYDTTIHRHGLSNKKQGCRFSNKQRHINERSMLFTRSSESTRTSWTRDSSI